MSLNRFVHEGMNLISNVKVHLKTRSGNVNILEWIKFEVNFDMILSSLPQSLNSIHDHDFASHKSIYIFLLKMLIIHQIKNHDHGWNLV